MRPTAVQPSPSVGARRTLAAGRQVLDRITDERVLRMLGDSSITSLKAHDLEAS